MKFVISNGSAKIKASTHFGSMYLLCIYCCGYNISSHSVFGPLKKKGSGNVRDITRYNNQKSQIIILRAKLCDLQIFLLAINSHCTIYVTEYWKTDHVRTFGQLLFIGSANSHTHTLPVHCCINGLS